MKKFLLAACLAILLLGGVHAADKVPTTAPKEKSSFDAADVRDPFWPIGWKKPGPKSTSGGPALDPAAFSLTSVTMGTGPHFAILNGRIMQEGQQFGLELAKQIYQVTLRKIEDGRVVLVYQGGEITVSLRRK
jgi:hypothetical protein